MTNETQKKMAQRDGLLSCSPTRRDLMAAVAASGVMLLARGHNARATTLVGQSASSGKVIARSPQYVCNAAATTRDGTLFLGAPRWQGMEDSPSLFRVSADGSLNPFPGGSWNTYRHGDDPRTGLCMVNSVHIFADDTVWVVDQGLAPDRATVLPGGPKLVQFDPVSGKVVRVLAFDSTILPAGAQMNDLRISGQTLYVTDSGLGGIIVHDLASGHTLRRLSGNPLLNATPDLPLRGAHHHIMEDGSGKRVVVGSDMLEVTADGAWLYVTTPTGPLRRIPTAALKDASVSEADLAAKIETVCAIPTIMGTAIDTEGNLYLSDVENGRISLQTPSGARITLFEDQHMLDPDALFITADRHLLAPCTQVERLAVFNHDHNALQAPFVTLSFKLPETWHGHKLGSAVTGA